MGIKRGVIATCVALFAVVIFAACAPLQPQPSICDDRGDNYSWICDQSDNLGITPEDVYGWLLDGTALATVATSLKAKDVCEFVEDRYEFFQSVDQVTYTELISHVFESLGVLQDEDQELYLVIKGILNRNLNKYYNGMAVSDYDKYIITVGLQKFLEQMNCHLYTEHDTNQGGPA